MSEIEGPSLVAVDQEQEADEAPEELRRLIVFRACDEWFSLPIEWVREIQPLERVTRIPNAPTGLLGILNLRGRVLALYDLAGCLGIPPGDQPNTHAVVLDFADPDLGVAIRAQRIAQVRDVPVSAIQTEQRESASGLEGAFELDNQVVGLLDLNRVFARALPEWGGKLEPRGSR